MVPTGVGPAAQLRESRSQSRLVGFPSGSVSSAANIRDMLVASPRFCSFVYWMVFDIHATSAPAQKLAPSPASTRP